MATDGLWDNVFINDIKTLFKGVLIDSDPKNASEVIANYAKDIAHKT